MNKNQRLASLLLTGLITMSCGVTSNALETPKDIVEDLASCVRHACKIYKHDRIVGRDRYETGALVARRVSKYDKVVLVNAENNMSDGLSASSLAGNLDATILPIKSKEIPKYARDIVNKAREVYIVGGESAISKEIEESLNHKKIVRFGGSDRCETSAQVAKYLGDYDKAFIVNGYRGEADAMSISAVAARDGAPIILTNGKSCKVPKKKGIEYIVIGGRAVVTEALAHHYDAQRIGGADRYETNREVINTYSKWKDKRYFCNGETLVDALSASYLAKDEGIVLVNEKENHDLLKYVDTVQVGGPDYDIYFPDLHRNNEPSAPEVKAIISRKSNRYGEFKTDFKFVKPSVDKDGDKITYEWKDRVDGDFYGAGKHTVQVRAVDDRGGSSAWVPVEFEVLSHAPSAPEIAAVTSRTVDEDRNFKTEIYMTKYSYDSDGDAITYEWQGRTDNDYYSPGTHEIKVRAVDATGAASRWVSTEFTIADNAPSAPKISAEPTRKNREDRKFFTDILMTEESSDEDDDPIRYEWDGKIDNGYYSPGNHTVKVRAVDSTGAASEWTSVDFRVDDTAPTAPELEVKQTREVDNSNGRKFKTNVIISKESIDADGDDFEYVWEGIAEDSLYEPNLKHTVRVKAVDSTGAESEWTTVNFNIPDTAPTVPEIEAIKTREMTLHEGNRTFKVDVPMTKESTDAEGDPIEYVWEGVNGNKLYTPNTEHTVRVKAVDETGAESAWKTITFNVADNAPTNPDLEAILTRDMQLVEGERKFKVNINQTLNSTDEDNDEITYEWVGNTEDGLYTPGEEHSVKLRAVDSTGATSEWVTKTFTVEDNKPTKPEISVTKTREVSDSGGRKFKVNVVKSKDSTDADSDAIEYVWEGLNEDGFYAPNTDHTVKLKAVDATNAESEWETVTFNVTDNAPTEPKLDIDISERLVKNGKLSGKVNLTESVDADGDKVTYEWEGKDAEGYYTPNEEQTIRVRALDSTGLSSDWVEKKFTIVNRPPSAPTITRTPNTNYVLPGTSVKITGTNSVDPDGDEVHYVWEGRPSEDSKYKLGKNFVKVKAVDSLGAESVPAAIMFFVMDPNGEGGMILTGPTSKILEEGAEYATITNYEFNVPAVSGHSGNDYGLVEGRVKSTGRWEQIKKQTTSNGVNMKGDLPSKKYDQLRFTYYTDHDCMYNKSNITYSVGYEFDFTE